MMAAQPYPAAVGYPVNLSPTQSRNMYRTVAGSHSQSSPPVPAHSQFPYSTPTASHSGMYRSPVPELNSVGLITPPTATPSQFGSPMIASGPYGSPMPLGTPSQPWGPLNALALSPIDPALSYGYRQPSPIMDPMSASGEVFSTVPLRHHDPHIPGDALGFHHPGVYPPHGRSVFGPGAGMGPHGHLILGADGQPTTEIKKRSRSAQACERCRVRKARCFGGNPCNRCTKRRFVCEFSTAVRQRGPNKPQVNANVNGSAGPNSAPASAVSSTSKLRAKSGDTPTGGGSSSAASTPGSPPKGGPRRHSLPEGSVGGTYIPPPPKSFSTDAPRLASVNEEQVPYLGQHSWTTVVPNLPTSASGGFLVPSAPGSASDGGVIMYPVTPTMPTTASTTPGGGPGEQSPMFTYTPEMESGRTTSSSTEYPFTPISPATNFAPSLTMTPPSNGTAACYSSTQTQAQAQAELSAYVNV